MQNHRLVIDIKIFERQNLIKISVRIERLISAITLILNIICSRYRCNTSIVLIKYLNCLHLQCMIGNQEILNRSETALLK